jgi:hypothetical protein
MAVLPLFVTTGALSQESTVRASATVHSRGPLCPLLGWAKLAALFSDRVRTRSQINTENQREAGPTLLEYIRLMYLQGLESCRSGALRSKGSPGKTHVQKEFQDASGAIERT